MRLRTLAAAVLGALASHAAFAAPEANERRGATHFVTSTDEAKELAGQRIACNEAAAGAHPGSTHAELATSTDEARRIAGERIAATQGARAASNIDLPTSSDEARWLASARIRFSTSGCDSRLG
jgi:hypothetical protein